MFNLEKVIFDCKRQKRKAQVLLYKQYSSQLLGVCMRYVADKSEAEDILQDAFLKIFNNIKEYNGKGHFEGWMRKIVVNTAITHFHKHKKHYYHDDIDDVEDADVMYNITPETEYDEKELLKLLNKMPDGYRVIFNLYAVEGFKHKEIAEKLNIEENTSKSQYLRAKKWLVKEMSNLDWL